MPDYTSNYCYCHTVSESVLSLDANAALQTQSALQPDGESRHSVSAEICQKVKSSSSNGVCVPVLLLARFLTLNHSVPRAFPSHFNVQPFRSPRHFNSVFRFISSSKEKRTRRFSLRTEGTQTTICRQTEQNKPSVSERVK